MTNFTRRAFTLLAGSLAAALVAVPLVPALAAQDLSNVTLRIGDQTGVVRGPTGEAFDDGLRS